MTTYVLHLTRGLAQEEDLSIPVGEPSRQIGGADSHEGHHTSGRQGTLHMLILRTVALEPIHGYGIGIRLEQISQGVFKIKAGSLFPALVRLERSGLIAGEWRTTENNRRAKYYSLTAAGRAALKRETRDWEKQTAAITRIFEISLGDLS